MVIKCVIKMFLVEYHPMDVDLILKGMFRLPDPRQCRKRQIGRDAATEGQFVFSAFGAKNIQVEDPKRTHVQLHMHVVVHVNLKPRPSPIKRVD